LKSLWKSRLEMVQQSDNAMACSSLHYLSAKQASK
jgi:hypothetical protein